MKKTLILLCALLGFLVLAGCGEKSDKSADVKTDANVLTVLAGSELKDIEPLLPQIERATGYKLRMRYKGTLDSVEALQSGENVDLVWLANNHYAMLIPGVKSRILASERTMLTPVVLGLKESRARELGWIDNPNVTWRDIAEAATKGKFTFGMTSPTASNTGFSGLLGLAAALSGRGDALEEKDIDTRRLTDFFKAQRMTSGSSGWLSDAYLKDQNKVDGIINYSSTLLSMNRGGNLKEKLVLIYPRDGIVTADYPIMLINPGKRDAYTKLVAYLRGVEFQRSMADTTLRRPVNPEVVVAGAPLPIMAELSFPAKLSVVDAILDAFDNQMRLPADSTFVLDDSGSMSGQRIDDLKTAMRGLSGADATISGRFARFRNRERIFLLPFNNSISATEKFEMGENAASNTVTLNNLTARVNALKAGGGTAIFSAVQQAYTEAMQRRSRDPARFYSIVVMTDGQNASGINMDDFATWYTGLPEASKGIRVFTVLFGDADPGELQKLSDLTGGKLFDSRKASLQSVFKEIRGYQ